MAGLTFGLALDFGSKLRSVHAQLERQSALLEAAERAGFAIVAAGETSAVGTFHLPNALLVLASLAQRTRLRLCTGILLLPAWPVWKLALDTALLDQLSGGRLILGTGLGTAALRSRGGWSADAVGETADETLEAVRQLWSGAPGYAGKHVQVDTGLPITPANARVPIWVGGSLRRSAARAARLGDGWYGGITFRLLDLPRQTQAYRAASGAGAVTVNRVTLLAETESQLHTLAEQYAAPALMPFAQPGESFQQVADEIGLVGTPAQVSALLERYQAAGATHVMTRLSMDDMPPEVARGTIELLGREVIPRFAVTR